jgi:EAL domain-containing protein (putative c-di-GMP-specific phosphodiesterase class I)
VVTSPEAQDLAQALAEHLDTLPPLRGEAVQTAATAAVAAPVAIAAVVAARSAVEARLAVKAAPMAVHAAPAVEAVVPARIEPSSLPVIETVLDEPIAEIDVVDDDLAEIGAQLAAGLGAEHNHNHNHNHEPALDLNVNALKSAVEAMRAQPTVAALAAALDHEPQHNAGADDAAIATSDPMLREKLALISSALDEDRFDVCLEAIIGLDDRRAQHYEVTVRLKGIDDDVRQVAMGSGLLPLLDAAIVDQSARIAWKLEDRGKAGSLFSQITGESLESDRFLNRFADTFRHSETVASRLILAFTQGDLRSFTAAHWATLRDMSDLGFRFSLEELTDLDLDFATLKEAGFAFVKLDAAVFLSGLPVATSTVPADQISRYLEDMGLVVIVGRIADENQYEQVLDSGVGLGQGMLFGIARPVKSDVLKTQQRAVA